MKKLSLAILLIVSAVVSARAQSLNPTVWTETDGLPRVSAPTKVIFGNGVLSCSGKVCTVTVSGGSGTVTSIATTSPITGGTITTTGTIGCATCTTNAAALTSNAVVLGAGSQATKVVAGIITDGTSLLTLGVAGTSVGGVAFNNATSGTITLQPVTGALGTVTLSLPATTGTLALTSALPAGANPTASVGLTAVNGSAVTFLRSDGAPALDQGIVPTWTGIHTFTNGVTTGTGSTSGTVHNYNSLTTGTGAYFTSSSVTSGNVVNITATGTAAASNTKTALNVATSGANSTSTQSSFGIKVANTSTGTTSSNFGIDVTVSAGTNNYGIRSDAPIITTGSAGFTNGVQGTNAIGFQLTGQGVGLISTGQVSWAPAGPYGSYGDVYNVADLFLSRKAIGVLRIGGASSGAGSVVIGTSTVGSIGTSGVGVLAIANGTAPSSSPADEFQLYSADAAAGSANAYIRNELGEVNRISGLSAINTSAFAKTSDTTLANITGLSRNVEAGRTYSFHAELDTTAAATGGVKFAVSGTATATSINYSGILVDGVTILANTRATALDTTVCASTTSTAGTCIIKGTIVVNAAGTLTLQFAQNASDGGASTVLINQYLQLIPIS